MRVAGDTSPEADAVQTEAYRRMGGHKRAETLFRLTRMARAVSEGRTPGRGHDPPLASRASLY
jgi:hypothetical protein